MKFHIIVYIGYDLLMTDNSFEIYSFVFITKMMTIIEINFNGNCSQLNT